MEKNTLRVGLLGYGAVGQEVAHLVREQTAVNIHLVGEERLYVIQPNLVQQRVRRSLQPSQSCSLRDLKWLSRLRDIAGYVSMDLPFCVLVSISSS
jgi:homoserine dehydrogenase